MTPSGFRLSLLDGALHLTFTLHSSQLNAIISRYRFFLLFFSITTDINYIIYHSNIAKKKGQLFPQTFKVILCSRWSVTFKLYQQLKSKRLFRILSGNEGVHWQMIHNKSKWNVGKKSNFERTEMIGVLNEMHSARVSLNQIFFLWDFFTC